MEWSEMQLAEARIAEAVALLKNVRQLDLSAEDDTNLGKAIGLLTILLDCVREDLADFPVDHDERDTFPPMTVGGRG